MIKLNYTNKRQTNTTFIFQANRHVFLRVQYECQIPATCSRACDQSHGINWVMQSRACSVTLLAVVVAFTRKLANILSCPIACSSCDQCFTITWLNIRHGWTSQNSWLGTFSVPSSLQPTLQHLYCVLFDQKWQNKFSQKNNICINSTSYR